MPHLCPTRPIRWYRLLLPIVGILFANYSAADEPEAPPAAEIQTVVDDSKAERVWMDRMQEHLYRSIWRSAMGIDRMFGSEIGEAAYQETTGSLSPALLWNE